ncbi:MAG: hypothetical protein M3281_03245 [Chloroflexota bacterium]|nr:hypothetical protein [Chloroflexota bacterium]
MFGSTVHWANGTPQVKPGGSESAETSDVPRYSDPEEGWRYLPVLLERLWELGLDGWLVRSLLSRLGGHHTHDEDADTSTARGTVVKELLFGSVSTGEKLPEMACRAALEAIQVRGHE